MYGIDWDAPLNPKQRKPRKPETKPRKTRKTRSDKGKIKKPKIDRRTGNPTGRPKGTVQSAESRVKSGQSCRDSAWRRHTSDKGASMQSASGYGDADFSVSSGHGRVHPRYCPYDREWNE